LFDFRLVTGIDSSATFSFTQIKQIADQCGARMIFTRLTREVENAFRATQLISDHIIVPPNLDAALESCENAIIRRTKRITARPAACASGLLKRSAVQRMLTS